MAEKNNEPIKQFRAGSVCASIWKNVNENKKGIKFDNYSVTCKRGYKDKDDNWKDSQSYSAADLGKVRLVLAQAYEYIVTLKKDKGEE